MSEASEMALWVKELVAKPYDLSLIPGAHLLERENRHFHIALRPPRSNRINFSRTSYWPTLKFLKKINKDGTGEMAQWLRILVALAEDPGSLFPTSMSCGSQLPRVL